MATRANPGPPSAPGDLVLAVAVVDDVDAADPVLARGLSVVHGPGGPRHVTPVVAGPSVAVSDALRAAPKVDRHAERDQYGICLR